MHSNPAITKIGAGGGAIAFPSTYNKKPAINNGVSMPTGPQTNFKVTSKPSAPKF